MALQLVGGTPTVIKVRMHVGSAYAHSAEYADADHALLVERGLVERFDQACLMAADAMRKAKRVEATIPITVWTR